MSIILKTNTGAVVYLSNEGLKPLATCQDNSKGVPNIPQKLEWFSPNGILTLLDDKELVLPVTNSDQEAVSLISAINKALPELFNKLNCVFEAEIEQANGRVLEVRYTDAVGILASLNNPELQSVKFTINSYA